MSDSFFPDFESIPKTRLKNGDRIVLAGQNVAIAGRFVYIVHSQKERTVSAIRVDELTVRNLLPVTLTSGDTFEVTIKVVLRDEADGRLGIESGHWKGSLIPAPEEST